MLNLERTNQKHLYGTMLFNLTYDNNIRLKLFYFLHRYFVRVVKKLSPLFDSIYFKDEFVRKGRE